MFTVEVWVTGEAPACWALSSGSCCSPSLGGSECSEDIIVDEHYDDSDELGDIMTWGYEGAENDIMQQTMLSILEKHLWLWVLLVLILWGY